MLCRASLASAMAEPTRSSPKSIATRRKSSARRPPRGRSGAPSPPSVVSSQTPPIAPTRFEPVSPSIARSRRVNQAPTRTGPAKIPSSSSGASVQAPRQSPAPSSDQRLLGPPRPQVEQVEEVGGEDQQRDVGEVAPRFEAAPGDDVGGERQRPDRLDRPGREAALRAAPARGRASRAASPAASPAPERVVEEAEEGDPEQVGHPAPQLGVEQVEVGAVVEEGERRQRDQRRGRQHRPEREGERARRGSSRAPGRRRAGPRTPAGTTSSATAIASGKPIQVTCRSAGRRQQVGQQPVGAALDAEAALGAEQGEDRRQPARRSGRRRRRWRGRCPGRRRSRTVRRRGLDPDRRRPGRR